jgi:hypothetical protein
LFESGLLFFAEFSLEIIEQFFRTHGWATSIATRARASKQSRSGGLKPPFF